MSEARLFELRRRTFPTPAFAGITFIESEARSIINHVPGDYLPFNWTINPYRGCSHSCSYCQSGETPILMADGRARPLAILQPGDRVYGTIFDGKYRRYVITDVLDHWETRKEAYRIRLEDGTELIASGDHRFLSNRGWKFVTGTENGRFRRPHLTLNSELLGCGRFAEPPIHNDDYRRGYLCGLIRGDAHIASRSYLRAGRGRLEVEESHQFRLALTDFEALRRGREFLQSFEVSTHEFLFQAAVGDRREMRGIRNGSRAKVAAIRSVIEWPRHPSDDWRTGFLAGIFDAEGGFNCGILRISNTDREIIEWITSSLSRFGFSYVVELRHLNTDRKPVQYVRMSGQLPEKLRFFHTVDPAITRKRSIEGFAIKNKVNLRVASVEPLGVEMPMYDITTGTGDFIANGVVSHNCFARSTHTYLDMDAGRDFETKIVVKVNAPQLLHKELRAKRWKGEHIAMGTATDPYQRAEGRYRLMRGILKELIAVRNPFSILTKGTLILRDLDLLTEAATVMDISTAFSVGTLDEDVWRRSEPGTPHPRKRLAAVRRLNEAGIPCNVLMAPVLPGISDSSEQMSAVVGAAFDAGATSVSPILLHLRPKVREVYLEWLQSNYPELMERYLQMYTGSYARPEDRRAFGTRAGALVDEVRAQVRPARRPPAARFQRRNAAPEVRPKSDQLTLL